MKTTPFGYWLREHRKGRGLSQEALAELIGVDRTYVSKIENGVIGMPEIETRRKLHEEFGTSEDDLVSAGILRTLQIAGLPVSYVTASSPAIVASESGERAAIVEMLDRMPDDAVQHLRRFLEAITSR